MNRVDLNTWKRGDGDGKAVASVTKLGAAKNALALAQDLPDITDLIDHASAVRAAAKSMHVSAPGINAWMRFVIDAERKGWAQIEALRASGELVTQRSGTHAKRMMILGDLIERSPTQRASEWAMLAKLSEFQLDEAERVANAEDRLLTKGELMKLAKASTTSPSKAEPRPRSAEDVGLIEQAQIRAAGDGFAGDDIQIDDDAKINKTERGAWIEAWVWIEDELTRSDLEEEAK